MNKAKVNEFRQNFLVQFNWQEILGSLKNRLFWNQTKQQYESQIALCPYHEIPSHFDHLKEWQEALRQVCDELGDYKTKPKFSPNGVFITHTSDWADSPTDAVNELVVMYWDDADLDLHIFGYTCMPVEKLADNLDQFDYIAGVWFAEEPNGMTVYRNSLWRNIHPTAYSKEKLLIEIIRVQHAHLEDFRGRLSKLREVKQKADIWDDFSVVSRLGSDDILSLAPSLPKETLKEAQDWCADKMGDYYAYSGFWDDLKLALEQYIKQHLSNHTGLLEELEQNYDDDWDS